MEKNQEISEKVLIRRSIYYTLSFVFLLWLIKAVEITLGEDFAVYGILPRTLKGTIGIITAPLIHGSILHLMSNTIPLIMLGIGLWYFYYNIALEVFIWIYLVSGFWVWLLAREAYHIGASGLVYGIASFLFFSGLIRRENRLMVVSAIIMFLYGGMIYGVFPGMVDPNVSWETHLLASLAGVMLAVLFRKSVMWHKTQIQEDDDEGITSERPPKFSSPSSTTLDQTIFEYTYKKSRSKDKS